MLADWLSPVDRAVDRTVLTLVSVDTVADTLVELDTSLESAAEIESASVLTAVDVTLAEFSVLIRVDVPVEATVSRLVSVEVPVDTLWSEDRSVETAVCRPVVWLKASDWPAEAAVTPLIVAEIPVFRRVTWDRTDDTPILVVDRLDERLVNALRPEETWALVGDAPSATMVEIAVEKSTPSEVVPEKLVLFRVAPERTVEAADDTEVAEDSAELVTPDKEVCVDFAVLEEDEKVVSLDRALEAWLVCELPVVTIVEITVDKETAAELAAEIEPVGDSAPGSVAFRTFVTGKADGSRMAAPSVPAMTIRPATWLS